MTHFQRHDKIKYTTGPLGAVTHPGDTRFMSSMNDAQAGDIGWYVGTTEVRNDGTPETWHVTSKEASKTVSVSHDHPDGQIYYGPFIVVSDFMIEHARRNLQAIRQD